MSDENASPTIGATGYTIEDLSAYADAGREPRIDEIENDAECRAVLDSFARLGVLSREMFAQEVETAPGVDERWLDRVLTAIGRELRAGRDIPLVATVPGTSLAITEGAVRELVRVAGDSVEGVLVGASSIVGDIADPHGAVDIRLSISVLLGVPVHERAEAVRQRVRSEVLRHTELRIGAIDVTVSDLHEPPTRTDEG